MYISNDTISRRIRFMPNDNENQLIKKIKKLTFYAIQINEFTDINNETILLVYIRFVDTDLDDGLKEEFLCCLNLLTVCTTKWIFESILVYFDK